MSKARKPQATARPWVPLAPGKLIPKTPEQLEAIRAAVGDANMDLVDECGRDEIWLNDQVQVHVRRDQDGHPRHLSIRRIDRKPIRDWRVMQRIKNEIAGDECEAIELYPAESRVVDTSNQFHLWVMPPGVPINVGWMDRIVTDEHTASAIGAKQRPL